MGEREKRKGKGEKEEKFFLIDPFDALVVSQNRSYARPTSLPYGLPLAGFGLSPRAGKLFQKSTKQNDKFPWSALQQYAKPSRGIGLEHIAVVHLNQTFPSLVPHAETLVQPRNFVHFAHG